jgi:hypothetical protein
MATLTTNETLVDLYIERAIDLLRLEAGTRNKVFAILNDLEGELVAALAKADPTGVGTVSAQQKRLGKLLDSVRGAIRASYRSTSSLMTSEIREIVDQEAIWTGHAINTSIGVDFVTGGLTRAGLETIADNPRCGNGGRARQRVCSTNSAIKCEWASRSARRILT